MPCLGVLDGTPMSYWEIYRADLDPLARHYPARPHDTGIHLLIGGVADRGRGSAAPCSEPWPTSYSTTGRLRTRHRGTRPSQHPLRLCLPERRLPVLRRGRPARQAGRPHGPRPVPAQSAVTPCRSFITLGTPLARSGSHHPSRSPTASTAADRPPRRSLTVPSLPSGSLRHRGSRAPRRSSNPPDPPKPGPPAQPSPRPPNPSQSGPAHPSTTLIPYPAIRPGRPRRSARLPRHPQNPPDLTRGAPGLDPAPRPRFDHPFVSAGS